MWFNAEAMNTQPKTLRKLHCPGVMKCEPSRDEAPALKPVEPPAPCAVPRMRFIQRFIIVCAVLTLAGLHVGYIREYLLRSETLPAVRAVVSYLYSFGSIFLAILGPVFGSLCYPARTSRGSFLQLLGLVIPLLLTIWSCGSCWGDGSMDMLGYGIGMVWISLVGMSCWYLPLWLLHLLLTFVESRRRSKAAH